jgi:hypothetical protein
MKTGGKAAHTAHLLRELSGFGGGGGVPVLWREINSSLGVERQRSKLDVVYYGVHFAAGQATWFFFPTHYYLGFLITPFSLHNPR